MAGSKPVKNAAKTVARQDAPNAKPATAASQKPPTDWVARGNQLNIDAKAAQILDEEYIPQLKEAGYSKSQIKAIFLAEDPHLAAKQFIDDEKLALMDTIGAANYGFTPDQMLGMSLKDLRETASSLKKPGSSKPSRIRGKDPNASAAGEQRLPGSATATADAPLGATPDEVPPVVPQPSRKKISEAKAAAAKTSETIQANVEQVKNTGSMAGVNWLQGNRDSMVVGRDASKGNWAGITADDMTGERGPVFKPLPAEQAPSPKPGSQPKTNAGAGGSPPPPPPEDGKPVTKTDPLLRGATSMVPMIKSAFTKAPVASTAAASIAIPMTILAARHGLPMAYRGMEKLYGAAFGDGSAASQQQQQPQQIGPAPQIFILPREALRQSERPPAPQQPPAPAQAPPGKSARPDQSTDIIRALSGRMA